MAIYTETIDAAFERAALKPGGEIGALMEGLYDGDRIDTMKRRRAA